MNAEIAKEMVVFAAFAEIVEGLKQSEVDTMEAEIGAEMLQRIDDYVDAAGDGTVYREECLVLLRQKLRESATRLLALIEAETPEDSETDAFFRKQAQDIPDMLAEEGAQSDEVTAEQAAD
ncbi:hypothetical protein [Paenibacillus sp. YN15]|uniref:hypothetical protein n=1 Tax=Paenibacillus sp. YN15 TaxID=1742774 RepID=UPI0015EC41F6|nr:hypothetical protein [Paenibacillus sp. YN15]